MTNVKPIAIILIIVLAGLILASVGGVFTAEASSSFVPYTGATGNVDLGSWNLTAAYVSGITTAEVDWVDILNKPTTFAPSAHNQAWSTITDTPTYFNTQWSQITNIPSTFTPSSHTHVWSDIVSGVPEFVVNGTGSYFTGKVDWSQVQNPPSTYAPSAHNHAASDINSGTFGTGRLDLSALAQNIVFASTQTVDGVDISALLLKTVKVTDLATIWDKTTKIVYGDTDFADQAVKTTSNVTFNNVAVSSFSKSRAHLSSGQTIGVGWVKVTLDVEDYDVLGEFTGSRFTVTVAGYYQVVGQVYYSQVTADKTYLVGIFKNTSTVVSMTSMGCVDPSFFLAPTLSDVTYLGVGDYLELFTYHNVGVNQDIAGASYATYFVVVRVI